MAKYQDFHWTRKIKGKGGNKTVEYTYTLNLSRFGKQLGAAQFKLDSVVMADMVPLMPMETGTFINKTKAMSAAIAGTGHVIAASPPEGRFLYEGKTMVDEATGSPWARKGARKALVSQYAGKTNASENLTYAHGRTSHWFDKAKEKNLQKWRKIAKETAGGG